MTVAVPVGLVLLAGIMVLLNVDGGGISPWSIPLAIVAVALLAAWQKAPIVSLVGLALITLAWALAELPGSLGILILGPLVWIWIDRCRERRDRLAASIFAALIAVAEGLIGLITDTGSGIDLVGNLALVGIASAAGEAWRRLAIGESLPPPDAQQTTAPPTQPDPVEAPVWLEQLSGREREVLAELVAGASNNDIADRLHISLSTVKTHVSSILSKADAKSRYAVALQVQGYPLTETP